MKLINNSVELVYPVIFTVCISDKSVMRARDSMRLRRQQEMTDDSHKCRRKIGIQEIAF